MAARAFTHLADLIIAAALDAVSQEMRAAHGDFPGGRIAIAGMGKLGSFELTAGSDIDLILLYDYDDAASESDGPKPLDAMRYFTRITQRLIAALLGADGRRRALRSRHAACAPPATRGRSQPASTPSASISARKPGPGSTWRSAAPG